MGNNCQCLKFSEYGNELTTDKKEKINNKNIFYQKTPTFGNGLDDTIQNYDAISFRAKGGRFKNDLKNFKNNKINTIIKNLNSNDVEIKEDTINKNPNIKSGLDQAPLPDYNTENLLTIKKEYLKKYEPPIINEVYSYDFFVEINNLRDDNKKYNKLIEEDISKIFNKFISIYI